MTNRLTNRLTDGAKPQDANPSINIGDALVMWLRLFEKCIRGRDYETGTTLFHKKSIAFFVGGADAASLDEVVEKEWKQQWPNQLQFAFDVKSSKIIPCGGDSWVIALPWYANPVIIGGGRRSGRATFLLKSFPGALLCVHSHFSTV